MVTTAIELALQSLLQIEPMPEKSPSPLTPVAKQEETRRRVELLVRSAAAFLEILDQEGNGAAVRLRAELVWKATAEGTSYDEYRKKFIDLFPEEEEIKDMGLSPLSCEFGRFLITEPVFYPFPNELRNLQKTSAEYGTYVPYLKAMIEYRVPMIPHPWEIPEGEEKTRVNESASLSVPSTGLAESPVEIARVWLEKLHQLELLTEKDHFWGCSLILTCRYTRDPAHSSKRRYTRLCEDLERQFSDVLPAIQTAALDIATYRTKKQVTQCSHDEDFRDVTWFGKRYMFTPNQAKCVECLWAAWEKGRHGVSKQQLLRACETESNDVKDVFKGSPAWRTMIISPQRGIYCLNTSPQS